METAYNNYRCLNSVHSTTLLIEHNALSFLFPIHANTVRQIYINFPAFYTVVNETRIVELGYVNCNSMKRNPSVSF